MHEVRRSCLNEMNMQVSAEPRPPPTTGAARLAAVGRLVLADEETRGE